MSPDDPRLLLLETSGRIAQVALARGQTLLAGRRLAEARRHARDLVPAVAELLAAQGWTPRDVQGVLVSRGPGSYTGLRVGIMSAKTFAYATGCALLAIDTFAAIALQGPAEATALDVIADAQQDKVYGQRFTRPHPAAAWVAASPLIIEKLADWLGGRQDDVWVTGPGLCVYGARLPPKSRVVDSGDWDPRPESLLKIALDRYRAGERDDLWKLEPLYLRPSSAEEKWRARSPT